MSRPVRLVFRNDRDAVWHEVLPLWNAARRSSEEEADVGFYLRLVAAAGRPVVELGIGYGRVAQWTRPDYGVDASPRMLRTCAERVPDITMVVAKLQDYVISRPAALSYAPQNQLSLLGGQQEVLSALSAIRRNTQPGGRLAFDVAVADWDRIRRQLDRVKVRGQVGDLRLSYRPELLELDRRAGHGTLHMHHFVERLDSSGEVVSRTQYPPVTVNYFSPRRWTEMLDTTDWQVQRCWGGFHGEPLTSASKLQVWLVRR